MTINHYIKFFVGYQKTTPGIQVVVLCYGYVSQNL